MKKILKNSYFTFILFGTLGLLISSCATPEDVVYFQNIDSVQNSKTINSYVPVYQRDDLVSITVSALDQDAVIAFNLRSNTVDENDQGGQSSYLVDSEGNIEFPVLGKIKLAGLNRIEATNLLQEMLKDYIKNPIVNIRTINFKVTILGDVSNPGSYTIPNERLTIIEALGLAGDLTIQGRRDNILVIRDNNGIRTQTRINLKSEDVFNSPFYYLTQNDVVYVQPNKTKVRTASQISNTTTTTISIISSLIAIVALVIR